MFLKSITVKHVIISCSECFLTDVNEITKSCPDCTNRYSAYVQGISTDAFVYLLWHIEEKFPFCE